MSHLFWSVLFAALYGFLGVGVTLLCLPAPVKRYTLPIAPLAGFSLATLAAWYFAAMGFAGTDAYAARLCLLALAPLGTAVYLHGRGIGDQLLNRDSGLAAGLGLLGFVTAATPSMIGRTGLTAISLGNADIAFYAIMARYLKEFGLGQAQGFFSQQSIPIGGTAIDRFGAVIATALPASLSSLDTYQLQNVATHVFFAITVMMAFIVAREVFELRRGPAALGTLLVAINPLLAYTVFHDFVAQIIGMALALLLVVLHTHVVRRDSFTAYRGGVAMVALMTWGLSATYGHIVPILLLAIGAWVSTTALQCRSARLLARWIGFSAATIVVVVICSPARANVAVGQLEFFGGGVGSIVRPPQGWFVPWLFPSGLFTIPRAFPWAAVDVPVPISLALGVSFFALVFVGLVEAYRGNRSRFVTVLGWMVPIVVGTTVLAYFDRSPAGWGGYASYKFLSFFAPIVLLCLAVPIAGPLVSRPIRGVALLSLAVIAVTSVQYSWRLVEVMRATRGVNPAIVELQRVEAIPKIDSVNIPDSNEVLNTMWKANFLARKTLYIQETTYFPRSVPEGNWTLLTTSPPGPAVVVLVGDDHGEPPLQINRAYSLARAHSRLRVDFGEGWYPTEATARWTGNGGASDAALLLNVLKDSLRASIALEYSPLNPQNQLSLYLDDRAIGECPKGGQRCVVEAELLHGARVLRLHASLAPQRPDNGDPRVLGFLLTRIEVDEIPAGARTGSP